VEQNKIHVDCQYMGGASAQVRCGQVGTIGAALAKQTGPAIKLMLERDLN